MRLITISITDELYDYFEKKFGDHDSGNYQKNMEVLLENSRERLEEAEKNADKIEIIGTSLTPYQNLEFSLPSNRFLKYVPTALVKMLGRFVWVRPKPDKKKCRRCEACINTCPTRAMTSNEGFPSIDFKKCISCFCCDEVCPHEAIDQQMSWLAKKFRYFI